MCFEITTKVDFVEHPDVTETFKWFKIPDESLNNEANAKIEVAARIYLENKVVEAVLYEAKKYPYVETLSDMESIKPLADRSVVICSMSEQRRLEVQSSVYPGQVMATPHLKLQDKVIVLQLRDFSYLAQYSLCRLDVERCGEDVKQVAEIRIKINVDSESGVVYHRK